MSEFGFIDSDQLMLSIERYMVLDIRDRQSFDSGHISGAIHINSDNVNNFIDENDLSTPIVVCCYHGNSSQRAAQFLTNRGFKNVYSLNGGYEQWKSQENK